MSDPVDYVPFETTTTPVAAEHSADAPELERLYDVPVELAVEIGRTHMTIRETLALGPGSIVTLNRLAGEPVAEADAAAPAEAVVEMPAIAPAVPAEA